MQPSDDGTSAAGRVHRLESNQPPERAYRGGGLIAQFRGEQRRGTHVSEDWVGSSTSPFGDESIGRTTLEDGRLLADHIGADPISWLGHDHVARWGADPALLTKLLDVEERLCVHFHPDRDFAGSHLGSVHGKTEAWIMMRPTTVWVGFSRDIGAEELRAWVDGQDVDAMFAAMNQLELAAGDSLLVPAGVPHAIAAGAFLIELQEPTDFSIRLEWPGSETAESPRTHLALGYDLALTVADRGGWTPERLENLVVRASRDTPANLLPGLADEFFRASRHTVRAGTDLTLDQCYSVVFVLEGSGEVIGGDSRPMPIEAGSTVLLPWAAGPVTVTGDVTIVLCQPPAPGRDGVDA